jgi:hypothetical protein
MRYSVIQPDPPSSRGHNFYFLLSKIILIHPVKTKKNFRTVQGHNCWASYEMVKIANRSKSEFGWRPTLNNRWTKAWPTFIEAKNVMKN